MMYPEADIPSLQFSQLRGLDPAAHLALGEALRALLDENILVIGSGFSFHNGEESWLFRLPCIGPGIPGLPIISPSSRLRCR